MILLFVVAGVVSLICGWRWADRSDREFAVRAAILCAVVIVAVSVATYSMGWTA